MLILTILEVALGLGFVYLLLSLLVSWFTEIISSVLQMRARSLEAAIKELLKDPPGLLQDPAQFLQQHPEYQGYRSFAEEFYGHPLIRSLSKTPSPGAEGRRPEFIPARTFALVAFDILFPNEDFLQKDVEQLRQMILSKHLHPDVETALVTFVEGGARDIESLRGSVETWFNDAMDQLSAWYKRGAMIRSLIAGVAIAVVLNVDTILIANTLWQEPNVRAGIASYVQANLNQFQPQQPGASNQLSFGKVQEALTQFEFPIGWRTFGPGNSIQQATAAGQNPAAGVINWLWQRLLGWILTGIAVAQGAPFWFDLLRKMISIGPQTAAAK